MAPRALDTDIDKRHWAPDQIGVRQAQLLVDRRTTGGATPTPAFDVNPFANSKTTAASCCGTETNVSISSALL